MGMKRPSQRPSPNHNAKARWLLRVAITAFLIGALANMLVTAICVLSRSSERDSVSRWTLASRLQSLGADPPSARDVELWQRYAPSTASDRPKTRREQRQLGKWQLGLDDVDGRRVEKTMQGRFLTIVRAGWPVYSVEGIEWRVSRWAGGMITSDHHEFIRTSVRRGERFIPLSPLWLGLSLNSLFYAVMLFPAVVCPELARRAIRKRRGACVSCGYLVFGQPMCPECGWIVLRKDANGTESGCGRVNRRRRRTSV